MLTSENVVRVVRFSPYGKGAGPVFRLVTWDTGRAEGGKWVLGYRLSIGRTVNVLGNPPGWHVLFEGEDFACSPLHAIDSDETVAGIMAFLTLRPGDTDRDYFRGYTRQQMAYCAEHAEALASEVYFRFGER